LVFVWPIRGINQKIYIFRGDSKKNYRKKTRNDLYYRGKNLLTLLNYQTYTTSFFFKAKMKSLYKVYKIFTFYFVLHGVLIVFCTTSKSHGIYFYMFKLLAGIELVFGDAN